MKSKPHMMCRYIMCFESGSTPSSGQTLFDFSKGFNLHAVAHATKLYSCGQLRVSFDWSINRQSKFFNELAFMQLMPTTSCLPTWKA